MTFIFFTVSVLCLFVSVTEILLTFPAVMLPVSTEKSVTISKGCELVCSDSGSLAETVTGNKNKTRQSKYSINFFISSQFPYVFNDAVLHLLFNIQIKIQTTDKTKKYTY